MGARKHLRPDEYADQAAEAIRSLNHATINGRGYVYPADVDAVIAHLSATTYGMLQSVSQMQRWLFSEADRGRVRHDQGEDVETALEELSGALLVTAGRIEQTVAQFDAARRVSAHLTQITPSNDRTGK